MMGFDFTYTKSTKVNGVVEVTPSSFSDTRGSIWTSADKELNRKLLPSKLNFCHDKFVQNGKNVLRGLHGDYKTFKLVMCPVGEVFQVALDVRNGSPTFGKIHTVHLNEVNKISLLLPPGVANGFMALSDMTLYHYKLAYLGDYIDADEQFTIRFDDPAFSIPWPSGPKTLSDRDKILR